jgi:hypothetical protein
MGQGIAQRGDFERLDRDEGEGSFGKWRRTIVGVMKVV